MATRRNRGFTLVELLVVITIIGMLAALILPALGSAREAARQAQCQNNLKQMATAVQGYVTKSSTGFYPPSFGDNVLNQAESWNWATYLLQYTDQEKMFKLIRRTDMSSAEYFALYVCPSDDKDKSTPALSYGANMGIRDGQVAGNSAPLDLKYNGIFHSRKTDPNPPNPPRPIIKFTEDDIVDGRANTLLFVENVTVRTWSNTDDEFESGVVWNPSPNDNPPPPPAVYFNEDPGGPADYDHALPNSRHPGVFSVVRADASTDLFSEEIAYDVYCRLMTPQGERSGTTGNPAPNSYQNKKVTEVDLNP